MLRPIYYVARATFHEAWRRRFLNGILVFAVLMIASSRVLMFMQPGAELNLLIDIGLGSIRFFGMLIAVFLGARLIADEIEKRTIYAILAKPVTRAQFLLGKFFGGVATVWSNVAVMGIVFYALFAVTAPKVAAAATAKNETFSLSFMYSNVAKAIGLSFFELFVIMALSVTFSTIFSWIVASIVTFFIYFVGQMSEFIHQLSMPERGASKVAQIALGTIYKVIPHFEIFDVREAILQQIPLLWDHLAKVSAQAVIYVVVAMLIGYLFFNQREV
jgi:ABC-type transport system involved in multi-copper enzyme maturation permease subunit